MEKRQSMRLYSRAAAKNVMSVGKNHFLVMCGFILCLAVSNSVILLYDAVIALVLGTSSLALDAVGFFLSFLVTSPMYIGLLRMCYLAVRGERIEVSCLLSEYSDAGRMRAAVCIALVRTFFTGLLFAVSDFAAKYALSGIGFEYDFADLPVLAAALLIAIIFSGSLKTLFLLPFALFASEESGKSTFSVSRRAAKHEFFEISLFNLGFVGLLILSLLTFGILFFVYLVPLYLFSSAALANMLINNELNEK